MLSHMGSQVVHMLSYLANILCWVASGLLNDATEDRNLRVMVPAEHGVYPAKRALLGCTSTQRSDNTGRIAKRPTKASHLGPG